MPYNLGASARFAGEEFDLDFVYGMWSRRSPDPTPEGSGFHVDLPSVLRMLKAAELGGFSAADVRAALLQTIAVFSERSGCCPDCDDAVESYEQALRDYELATTGQREHESQVTPESHPYIISGSGMVHAWSCRAPTPREFAHPGQTLQEYVHGAHYDGYGPLGYRLHVGSEPQRMTAEEMTEWLRGRRSVKRCKLCQPNLPGAFESEASDVEAGRRGG